MILIILLILLVALIAFFGIYLMLPPVKKSGKGNIEIACVGDSITYGQWVMFQRNYAFASLLPAYLGENCYSLNYGLCARTLLSTGDFPYNRTRNGKKFWNSSPDMVIFMLGTNDSKRKNWNAELFKQEYFACVERMKNMESQPKLYLVLPTKVFAEAKSDGACCNENILEGILPAIKEAGALYDVPVIDLYSFSQDHPEWFPDGVHPNKEGNEAIARKLCEEITAQGAL